MSVQYKMVGKNDNLNPEKSKKKGYYPAVVRKKTVSTMELAERAASRCRMHPYELEMALKTLMEALKDELLESNNVCLEGFGTFSLKAESRNVENPDELRTESIFVKKVAFKCSPILLKDLKSAQFVRYKGK
jgi:predicted histone-like DNA-binding protein